LQEVTVEAEILERVEKVIRIPDLILLDVSKDGSKALFVSNISGSYQLWAVDPKGGDPWQVSHGSDRVAFGDISPRSDFVIFSRDFSGREQHQLFQVPLTQKVDEKQISNLDGVRVFDFEISPTADSVVFGGSTVDTNCLWLFRLDSEEHQKLYQNKHSIFSPRWSESGKYLVAVTRTTDQPRTSELLFIDMEKGNKPEIYTPKVGSENSFPKWCPKKDDERVLFKTNAPGVYDLAVYDRKSKSSPTKYLGFSKFGVDIPHYGWTSDGEGVWFVAQKNGRSNLYIQTELGEEPKPKKIQTSLGKISNVNLSKDGTYFVYSWSSLSTPPQLSKVDIETGINHTIYKNEFNEGKELKLGLAEFVKYKSFDGLDISTFIVYSQGSKEPRPCILWPHGGPTWEVADEWNAAIQSISVAGFHVFCPNFRGSTGYGAGFEKMNIKDVGGGDLQDVIFGAKHVLESGIAKEGKIGIAGASYGGFMTFIAMTRFPDIFKAGAAIVGITDWKEMYDLSDAAYRSFIEELFGGRPSEENIELYKTASAINFVDQIKNPILVWHRANDSRCPLQPIEKFVGKLKELGRPHEFYIVSGEGHGFQKTENLVRQYKHVVAFLLKNMS
jgi:dipeptidyl aminopeptidase/acylaminoacyl peptidase